MSCVLRVTGDRFDPTAFAHDIGVEGTVWLRGDLDWQGRRREKAGGNFVVSDRGFAEFASQQSEAIAFLKLRGEALGLLLGQTGADRAYLDFGVWRNERTATQTLRLDPDLVRLAGSAGLALEVSLYPPEGSSQETAD